VVFFEKGNNEWLVNHNFLNRRISVIDYPDVIQPFGYAGQIRMNGFLLGYQCFDGVAAAINQQELAAGDNAAERYGPFCGIGK